MSKIVGRLPLRWNVLAQEVEIVVAKLPPEDRRIITPEEFRASPVLLGSDPHLLQHLDQHPEALYTLTPRQFEELMADLLSGRGYSVELTGQGRDGGVDIYATRSSDEGLTLVIVQCKRNAADNKVGEPVVKQLFADVELRDATRGLIATTSTFTSGALAVIEQLKYRLAGADADLVREWIRRAASGHS